MLSMICIVEGDNTSYEYKVCAFGACTGLGQQAEISQKTLLMQSYMTIPPTILCALEPLDVP